MKNMKKFEAYNAFERIDEGIFDFLNSQGVENVDGNRDVEQLRKIEDEVLKNYELSNVEIENIKTRIEDAISKKDVK